ncbi:Serine/threonine-kinase 11-interacting protein [Nymphaea thermarum]|nr:Serine/threonine-kinase 11-interacting protein [Nymphaea thermarum]
MAIVTGDRYLESLERFVGRQAGPLLDGSIVLKLNPAGLHYVQSRIEALGELEALLAAAPVDYLRAYVSDLGDHRALEQLRRILRLLTSLKVVSVLPSPARDPTPLSLLSFGRLKVLEFRGCDLSTSTARGLLALRPTLEKIICHNSTDALRHVFADRIAEIRKCPPWNRLTTVSCPCNGLVLMDESLHLLPAAETLDLSRNQFAKIDNLSGCTKLRYLDLGFNHLRTISSLIEVSCPIVKLVLRSNALTSLRGIENLKLLEGLDLSYNIISKFSEIEPLGSLPFLQNLSLEGNPICNARCYRAQVFSFFTNSDRLKLDEKGMDNNDFWKMKIIRSGRQGKPAGYGCYAPATESEQKRISNANKKKLSRIAHIEDSEHMQVSGSETVGQESLNVDDYGRHETGESEGETKLLASLSRHELIKKEKSASHVGDVYKSLDQDREELMEQKESPKLISRRKKCTETGNKNKQGESTSSSSLDAIRAPAHDDRADILASDGFLSNTPVAHIKNQYFVSCGDPGFSNTMQDGMNLKSSFVHFSNSMATSPDDRNYQRESLLSSLTDIDEIMETHHVSTFPGSPPYYNEGMLHQRQNLEEEFMQLSAGCDYVVSSDSDTSSTSTSDRNYCVDNGLFLHSDGVDNGETPEESISKHPNDEFFYNTYYCGWHGDLYSRKNGRLQTSHPEAISGIVKALGDSRAKTSCTDDLLANAGGGNHGESQDMQYMEKVKNKIEPKRRVIALSKKTLQRGNNKLLRQKLHGVPDTAGIDMEEDYTLEPISRQNGHLQCPADFKHVFTSQPGHLPMFESMGSTSKITVHDYSTLISDELMRSCFNSKVSQRQASETCQEYVFCSCIQISHQGLAESEVSIVLSSENKLYVLHISAAEQIPGVAFDVAACHRLGDIKDIVVGMGLLVFSWEQNQINLFDSHICGGLKVGINLYAMLLFWHENGKGESWIMRSIILIEGYIIICIEDLRQFGLFNGDCGARRPYFYLDSCCSICDISEMVIEQKGSGCVTLLLDRVTAPEKMHLSGGTEKKETLKKSGGALLTWRFKWFSEETLLNFVALVKAMYAGTTLSSLTVKYAT